MGPPLIVKSASIHPPPPSHVHGGVVHPVPRVQSSSCCHKGTKASPHPSRHVGSLHMVSGHKGSTASAGQFSFNPHVPLGQVTTAQKEVFVVG